MNLNIDEAMKLRDELNEYIVKQQKYKVLALDTDFHEIVTIASGLSLEEATEMKNKYKTVMIEVDN